MEKSYLTLLLLLLPLSSVATSQGNDSSHAGYLKGNRIHTIFNDKGAFGQPAQMGARGSWIHETNGYIGDMSFLLGLELPVRDYNNNGTLDSVHSVITCRVDRPTRQTDTDPLTGRYWTFAPVSGYCNPNQASPALRSDPGTWPESWPGHPELTGAWNGLFGPNEPEVSEEAYFRVDDRNDEHFNSASNNKWGVALTPDSTRPTLKGQGIHVDVRYLQSSLPEYRDVLFRVYDITNEGTTDYGRVVFGNLTGNYIGVTSTEDYREYANDAAVYFASGDFIMNQNVPENRINNPFWLGPVGKFGEAFLETPAGRRIASVVELVPSNVVNLGDDEYLWNTLRPGQYVHPSSIVDDTVVAQGEDMDYIYGSGYFSLKAGETKRVVSVLAYGYNKSQIQQKIFMAKALWSSGFSSDSVSTAIVLTSPVNHEVLSGSRTITWTTKTAGGMVSIWYSPDAGASWLPVTIGTPNSGGFVWNTASAPNTMFGLLRLFVTDSSGTPYGFAQTASSFTVYNGGATSPLVRILNGDFDPGTRIEKDTLSLQFLAGEPGKDSLSLALYYRTGKNDPWTIFDSYKTASDILPRLKDVNLGLLPNTDFFQIKFEASDGPAMSSDSTASFSKWTPRRIIPAANATFNGSASVVPRVDIVDRSQLRPDEYQITFVDTASAGNKTFSVFNRTEGRYTVKDEPFKSGVESPSFDGMALYADDAKTSMDTARTRWNRLGDKRALLAEPLNFDGLPEPGYPNPSDYQIVFYNSVVDTSIELNGGWWSVPATPVMFKVTDLMTNKPVKVAFYYEPFSRLEFLFQEEILGAMKWTWDVSSFVSADVLPTAGDTITVVTRKGLSYKDTLVVANYVDAIASPVHAPGSYVLYQNYPNPFNPTTTIKYTVGVASGGWQVASEAGAGSWALGARKTMLTVYDVLGRQVATLVNEVKAPGSYVVSFDGSRLASGIYFYRLTTGNFVQTRKMLLLK